MFDRLQDLYHKATNYLYCSIACKSDAIIVNGWLNIRFGRVVKRNFGDELNFYMLKELTGKQIIGYYDIPHLHASTDLLFIGSIVEEFTTPNSIIWGSGAISGEKPINHKPAKVCAVRGKLTRKYLIDQGISCPEVYGDPALLLPAIYTPRVSKKYKIGLIPHVNDLSSDIVREIISQREDIHLIRFDNYDDWHSVIDEINECESIISSSLHGLIISDAYQIPNVWVAISSNIKGGHFKFLDYFSAVNRTTNESVKLTSINTIQETLRKIKDYTPIQYNRSALIKASPFHLNIKP